MENYGLDMAVHLLGCHVAALNVFFKLGGEDTRIKDANKKLDSGAPIITTETKDKDKDLFTITTPSTTILNNVAFPQKGNIQVGPLDCMNMKVFYNV